ncbi:MAG: Holliday junction branch migration protein RuvA [bacterium]
MISYLVGTILSVNSQKVTLLVNNVGYLLTVSTRTAEKLEKGKEASFHVHLRSREDGIDLYGFLTQEELKLFELLNTVSGVGPKSALAVMEAANINDIQQAVAREDTGRLVKVNGIGPKTAGRIVLELKGKLDGLVGSVGPNDSKEDGEVADALANLGYKQQEIREALRQIDGKTMEEKIKQALNYLQK